MAANDNNPKKPAIEDVPAGTAPAAPAPKKQTADKREKAKGKKESKVMAFIHKADPIAMTCFVVFILAFGVVLGAYIDKMYINPDYHPHVIVEGDEVEVEYTGAYFSYYDEDSKEFTKSQAVVFDTNNKDVNDSESIIKSPGFTNKTKFDNLKFTVGGTQVLEMFGDSVIGHTKGQTVRVAIPDSEGYGTQASTAFAVEQTFQMSGTMKLSEFNELFDKDYRAGDFRGPAGIPDVESFFEGLTMTVYYDENTDKVSYIYDAMTVSAAEDPAKKVSTDDNVTYTVTEAEADTFTVKYIPDTDKDTMFEVINGDNTLGYIYKEKSSDDSFLFREHTDAEHSEQLGMTLYFTIKIVKVNA